MRPYRLAALDISRRPLASMMLIAAIALSVAAASLLFRLFLISENRFATLAAGGDAIIGAKSGELDILLSSLNNEGRAPGFLPFKLFQSLRNHQSVQFEDGVTAKASFLRSVIPLIHFAKFRDYRALGTDDSFFERPRAEDSIRLATGTLARNEREVVVGYRVAVDERLNLNSQIELTRWVNDDTQAAPENFKVVGILSETKTSWDSNVFTTVAEAQRVLGAQPLANSIWQNQVVTSILVYLQADTFEKLEGLVNNRSVGQTISISEATKKLRELTGLGARLGFLTVAIIVFLGGLTVCAVLISRYEGLSTQTAILRALGFQKSEVGLWLLSESLMIGIIALMIGGLLESACFEIFHRNLGAVVPALGKDSVGMLHLWPIWLATLVGTAIGTVFPMFRFYQQDIHTALRGL